MIFDASMSFDTVLDQGCWLISCPGASSSEHGEAQEDGPREAGEGDLLGEAEVADPHRPPVPRRAR